MQAHQPWPGLSAVVVAWNGADWALKAIAALKAEEVDPKAIWLVDAASPDGIPAALRAAVHPERILALSENLGYAHAANVGMAAAIASGAQRLWLQNHDAALVPSALASMMALMDAHPNLAMVAPRRWEGGEESAPVGVFWPALGWVRWKHGHPQESIWQAEVLTAAGALVRARAWEAIGPMDEGCFLYHEDIDWCLRAKALGWGLAVDARAWMRHERGVATGAGVGQGKPPLVDHLEWRNAWWLVGRHSLGWRRTMARIIALLWRFPLKLLRVACLGPSPRHLGWRSLFLALNAGFSGQRGRPKDH